MCEMRNWINGPTIHGRWPNVADISRQVRWALQSATTHSQRFYKDRISNHFSQAISLNVDRSGN